MPAYRNRPDRRKFPKTTPEPLQGPIMTFTATGENTTTIILVFSQPLMEFDQADAELLNSIRIWAPTIDFEGTAVAINQTSPTTLHVTFGAGPAVSDMGAIWIFDQAAFFRAQSSGARCTGNPALFEGV